MILSLPVPIKVLSTRLLRQALENRLLVCNYSVKVCLLFRRMHIVTARVRESRVTRNCT